MVAASSEDFGKLGYLPMADLTGPLAILASPRKPYISSQASSDALDPAKKGLRQNEITSGLYLW